MKPVNDTHSDGYRTHSSFVGTGEELDLQRRVAVLYEVDSQVLRDHLFHEMVREEIRVGRPDRITKHLSYSQTGDDNEIAQAAAEWLVGKRSQAIDRLERLIQRHYIAAPGDLLARLLLYRFHSQLGQIQRAVEDEKTLAEKYTAEQVSRGLALLKWRFPTQGIWGQTM